LSKVNEEFSGYSKNRDNAFDISYLTQEKGIFKILNKATTSTYQDLLKQHIENAKIIEEQNKKISELISTISDNQNKIAELTQVLEEKIHESATDVELAGLNNQPAPISETSYQ